MYGFYPGLFGNDVHGCIRVGQMVKLQNVIGTIIEIPSDDTPIIKLFCFDGLYRNYTQEGFENLNKEFIRFI